MSGSINDSETIAGYYNFGETPTVIDPRVSGSPDTRLTFIHENTHADLTNNTLYGYVISRLLDLSKIAEASRFAPERAFERMFSGSFFCDEGSATTAELVAVKGEGSKSKVRKFYKGLPQDYLAALRIYRPLLGHIYAQGHPLCAVTDAALVQAVAEMSMDFAVPTSDRNCTDFWELVGIFTGNLSPDLAVGKIVAAAIAVRPDKYHCVIYESGQRFVKDGDLAAHLRSLICEAKGIIADHLKIPPPISDQGRIGITRKLESGIILAFPELTRLRWSSKRILGGSAQMEMREPPFFLERERLAASRLPDRMAEMSQIPGFYSFVNELGACWPGRDARPISATAMTDISETLGMAQPILGCQDASLDDFRRIAQCGARVIWLARAFVKRSRVFMDGPFLHALRMPAFVYLQQFSWEVATAVSERFGEVIVTGSYCFDLGPRTSVSVVAVHSAAVSVFGIVPAGFCPPNYPKSPHKVGDLAEQLDLAAVALKTASTSAKQMITEAG